MEAVAGVTIQVGFQRLDLDGGLNCRAYELKRKRKGD